MNFIVDLNELAEHYDYFLIDIWGVIYEGNEPYPGSIDAINQLIAKGKLVIFLSNTPRPSDISIAKLMKWGIKNPNILTSGDIVRVKIAHISQKIYHIGRDKNSDLLANIGVNEVEIIDEAEIILLSAYLDEGEDLNQFDEILQKAALRNLPLICANPDKIIPFNDKHRYCSGVFAEKYIKLNSEVEFFGKPDVKIFEAVFAKFGINQKLSTVMIGDTIETDIKGALNFGIDSGLILSGNAMNYNPKIAGNIKPKWLVSPFTSGRN